MKLKFTYQKFQADAAAAVCEVFDGQPNFALIPINEEFDFPGYANQKLLISEELIKSNLQRLQSTNRIKPSPMLDGRYNLTIEMETGVGKTYTYIKTLFELNKHYGWSKFVIIVPSVAIREGVYKSFDITKNHFAEEYGKKIRNFVYNSKDLAKIAQFAYDSGINVMIINSQAFNSREKDARRIYMNLDSFSSRRPIDVIAATNPILIIDEPQSVEGIATKERLKQFNSLLTLRYSATHKKDSLYNLVYRLDALEAYNRRLVKKIAVKGISITGTTASEGYLYLEKINLYVDRPPAAVFEFEVKSRNRVRTVRRMIEERYNFYTHSGGLEEYRGYIVSKIDGLKNTVEFTNGVVITAGNIFGSVNEEQIRRLQIRETIKSHLEREHQLFHRGIKVLSLFFIDEVANYKRYDQTGKALNGNYADIFEEEYREALKEWESICRDCDYLQFLKEIKPEKTHAGYFSIDKRNKRMTNSKIVDRESLISDDEGAYNLIMRDKERLLDLKEPVRFIFSHSALREGWDNPNVFQICTLKRSSSNIRKRQEVGRGLRLCVNSNGERMDANVLGSDVHNVNVLTIIANESYDSFAKQLQLELAESVADGTIYDPQIMAPEDARSNSTGMKLHKQTAEMRTFNTFGEKISAKLSNRVEFENDELIQKSIQALDRELNVPQIAIKIEYGDMDTIKSKGTLHRGQAIRKIAGRTEKAHSAVNINIKYDLIGKIVEATGLTRNDVCSILQGINIQTFEQFRINPEAFILKASKLINQQKAAVVIKDSDYHK
ncbi:type III restriction enzyme, res subunit [Desulfosporosinus acididurans]|uniref:Type III restriction enzyme, res subunit n=1 Tax=Desulfosporosinus acididurans TaxID=476652 RepID=A0A0J1FSX8_9FIRM|nr:DEAD/DEAH box helicase family protein [Desulfosporosinus acididurans]KLU66574.1 type III restriction enzyme, res subunit [Desulfosporosinus acididurans]